MTYQSPMLRAVTAAVFAFLAIVSLSVSAAEDEFRLVIQDHVFHPGEIAVPAGKKVKLIIENRDATPEEFDSYALNREKVIAGATTAMVYIGPLQPGSYAFVGEYHADTAKGVVIAR